MRNASNALAICMAIGLALSAAACEEKGEPVSGDPAPAAEEAKPGEAAGEEAKAKAAAKPAKPLPEVAVRTVDKGGMSVSAKMPKDWRERQQSRTINLVEPKSGTAPTVMALGTSCAEGPCSQIAKNFEGLADKTLEMLKGRYAEISVAKNGAFDGGWEFQLDFTDKKQRKGHHYERYLFKDGWEKAAKCMVQLVGARATQLADFVGYCATLEAKPAGR